jgi:hypothetical protein
MFMEAKTAKHMCWHKAETRANPNVMVHPSDGDAWKHFSTKFLDFAMEARNVWLAIATGGFNPFSFGASQYSCWPVFVIPINLPPALCMKEEHIFLSLVVPGHKNPVKNLNVFMRPLNEAWAGVVTYDSFSKKNFKMRVSYHTSIHDYPALDMFSGWSTHGRLACVECMADVDSTWLPKGHKHSWFDCHRRFLTPDHGFRNQMNAFKKGVVVHDMPPRKLSGEEVLAYMNQAKANSFEGFGTTHNWTHIPYLWELPNFPKLLHWHNIDLMYTEKNVREVVLNTCLDMGKTKDNAKAHLDQELICDRRQFNLVEKPNNKWDKPRVAFCLTRPQRREAMKWLMDIKFPDGHAANFR